MNIDTSYYEDLYGDVGVERVKRYGPQFKSRRSNKDSPQKISREQVKVEARQSKEDLRGKLLDEVA